MIAKRGIASSLLSFMYAKVIPLIKLPRQIGIFDYAIPSRLQDKSFNGQLVEIPFRNKKILGIIISTNKDKSKQQLKEIIRIADNNPFLYNVQIELIKWAAFYYSASLATFAKSIIPEIPKTKNRHLNIYQKTFLKLKILKSDLPEITKTLKEINENDKVLYHWNDYKNKTAIYIKLLEKFSINSQIILIFPQFCHIEKFLNLMPDDLIKKTSVLHSNLSNGEYWQKWNKIRNNKSNIIIGTRGAIFAPTQKLAMIIIDDEQNASHKQWDQNPRYHTLKTALKLVELTGAKLIISSHTPSVQTFYTLKEKKDFKIANGIKKSAQTPIKIVEMQNEWKKGNNSIFSEEALASIKKIVERKLLAIVYINRRGLASFAVCKDCGYTPQCPNCHISLTVHSFEKNSILKCHHCSHEEPLRIPCPKCSSANICQKGTGTTKAKNLLEKIFPDIKITTIDLDVKNSVLKQNLKNLEDTSIIIGTRAILSHNLSKKPSFVLFLNIDCELQNTNFNSLENCMDLINAFKYLLKSPHNENNLNNLIVQTYSAGNPFLKILQTEDFKKHYANEIISRKRLSYPPFSQLIKLTFKHKNINIIKAQTEKIKNLLEKNFSNNKKISILGPIFLPMHYGKRASEIIIKNTLGENSLQEWLIKNIPPDWIIDIDPVEI